MSKKVSNPPPPTLHHPSPVWLGVVPVGNNEFAAAAGPPRDADHPHLHPDTFHAKPAMPCDEPCAKCGSTNIARQYCKKGSEHGYWHRYPERHGRYRHRSANSEIVATRDHIHHVCRCCQFRWNGLPLTKLKTVKAENP